MMEFLGSTLLTNVLLVAVAVFLGLLCVASKMLLWMGAELLTRFDPGSEAFVLSPLDQLDGFLTQYDHRRK
jgi:hypothetical protein